MAEHDIWLYEMEELRALAEILAELRAIRELLEMAATSGGLMRVVGECGPQLSAGSACQIASAAPRASAAADAEICARYDGTGDLAGFLREAADAGTTLAQLHKISAADLRHLETTRFPDGQVPAVFAVPARDIVWMRERSSSPPAPRPLAASDGSESPGE